jgi:putative phosphoesterase
MSRSSVRERHSSKEVGVISDTHGLVRDEAIAALQGCDLIVHAGDIGPSEVIERLRTIAPVHVVRGNNDRDAWGRSLPHTEVITVGEHDLYVVHDIADLDLDPAAAGFAAVICGHSHKPKIEWREGVLYLNPGSAGPRRFKLPIAVARIRISDRLEPEIIELAV